jgi:ppGpp synthetase/RelA/SpoT-type nucleotidyltranferase
MGTQTDIEQWYIENGNLYRSLLDDVQNLLWRLLSDMEIHILQLQWRVKAFDSFMRKITRKGYASPQQVTDLGGIRVVGFILSDAIKINKVVEDNFEVDPEAIEDKLEKLGVDRVGYISRHYVVSMSKKHIELNEYKKYKGLKFEIQVRTILQHAWAEIEHNRNYKFAGELTEEIKRRFYLLAGSLEQADKEFQRLSDDIDRYSTNISEQTKKGRLDIKIDPITIRSYFTEKYPETKETELIDKDSIGELESKGIKYLSDLESMVSKATEKYAKLAEMIDKPISRIAIADVYNSRDKEILRPKFLKAIFEISHGDKKKCVKGADALGLTGLGGYLEGIIPYVVADLEQDGLIEYCENKGEIRITQSGIDEVQTVRAG